uniref:Uncharacterized protein n=1 Tax=Ciona intestinalis TaxID=7719 RepID=H2XTV4_CIOIN
MELNIFYISVTCYVYSLYKSKAKSRLYRISCILYTLLYQKFSRVTPF